MKFINRSYINLIKEFSFAWFKRKDQRSALGFLWSFLNPIIMTTVLFLLFRSRIVMHLEVNYFAYILVGTVIWNFFATATTYGLSSVINQPEMAKNVVFPKEILVFSTIGVFVIQHVFELLAIFLFIMVLGIGFSWHLVFLPIIFILEVMLATGVALFLASICVFVWDLKHIWDVLTRIGFFTVPVFYLVSDISSSFRWAVKLNPVSQIIIFTRDILLYHTLPPIGDVCLVFAFNLFIVIAGYIFFKRLEFTMVEKA